MKTLYSWSVFFSILIRYLFWRAGLPLRRPQFTDYPKEMTLVVTQMFRWKKRVRVVNGEHCPQHHPAVFVSNHHKLDDPIDLWPGIHWGSGGAIIPGFVMRDDFFCGILWNWLPFNVNHLCEMTGAVLISRDQLRLSQLRQLLEGLAKPGTLVMFPGRTRSRTGAWFEYRDEFVEPGSAAFVISHTQRRHPELQVAAVPAARTWHPVSNTSAIVFGEPLYLASDADRETQRAADGELLKRVGGLVEVHAVHLAAVLIYLHVLHRGEAALPMKEIQAAVAEWTASTRHPHIEPLLKAAPESESLAAVRFFAERGLLRQDNGTVLPHADRILASPDWDGRYGRKNPVKYWANQVLHLPPVVQWAEDSVLRKTP